MIVLKRNGIADPISNSGRVYLHFTENESHSENYASNFSLSS